MARHRRPILIRIQNSAKQQQQQHSERKSSLFYNRDLSRTRNGENRKIERKINGALRWCRLRGA
ncbi:hypothetical protein RP20_CCG020208 [Aedes albopictus]|nr:hypothetical protein RP20_CCG020208 [Aedes albopictus]